MTEPIPPSKQQIEEWLVRIGKDRHWLAEKLNVSFGTVKGWLSGGRPITGSSVPLLLQLMHPSPGVNPEFSLEEWEQIEHFAARDGISPREWVSRVLKHELQKEQTTSAKPVAPTVNSGAQQKTAKIVPLPTPSALNSSADIAAGSATGTTGHKILQPASSSSSKRPRK